MHGIGLKPQSFKVLINVSSPLETITRSSSNISTFMLIHLLQLYMGWLSGIKGSGHTRISQPLLLNISGTFGTRSGLTRSLPGARG